jgi:hypothetical protein
MYSSYISPNEERVMDALKPIFSAGWDQASFAQFVEDTSKAFNGNAQSTAFNEAYTLFRQGWEIVPGSYLDEATNPALRNQQYDPPRQLSTPDWFAIRFKDQPNRADVQGTSGTGRSGTGTGGTGNTLQDQLAAYRQATEWATDRARTMTPEYLRTMMDYATQAAGQLDTRTQQAYAAMGIEPTEILGGMDMAMAAARDYMSGNVPQDVADQMRRALAERNINTGLQGPIADLSYARNLGLTTMQLQNYGPQLAGQVMSLSREFMPGTANLTNLYSGLVGGMAPYWFGAGSDIGTTMAQTVGSLAQQESANNIAIWQTLMQANAASATNAANLAWQTQQNAMQRQMWQAQQRAAQRNNYLSLGASIIGYALGGPIGGAIAGGVANMFKSSGGGYYGQYESYPTGSSYGSTYSPYWGYNGTSYTPSLSSYFNTGGGGTSLSGGGTSLSGAGTYLQY